AGGGRPSPAAIAGEVSTQIFSGPGVHPRVHPRLVVTDDDFEHWAATNLRAQKQAGYAVATATLPLGDIGAAQLRTIAGLAMAYAVGAVRVTGDQNLVFRWVRLGQLPALYRSLAAAG